MQLAGMESFPQGISAVSDGDARNLQSLELSAWATPIDTRAKHVIQDAPLLNSLAVPEGSPELVAIPQPPSAQPPQAARKHLSLGLWLDYVAIMSHLAFFGIVGVLARYGLEVLFGPEVAHVTDDHEALFIDVPANMMGSFLMGWVGVVMKKDIAAYSDPLATGLSTGLCGSITTFASWNQRMLAISTDGLWVRALAGYLIGAELAIMSLVVGIDSATACLGLLERWQHRRDFTGRPRVQFPEPDNVERRWYSLLFYFTASMLLWVGGGVGTALDGCKKRRRLWLALLVAPFGVWVRWYLARLNGAGLGKRQHFQWVPMGTLAANVVASALEGCTSTINLSVNSSASDVITGALQLGLLGSMSTVSTFVVEIRALWLASSAQWRAYAYCALSMVFSFMIGVFVYSIPVWVNDYKSRYNQVDSC